MPALPRPSPVTVPGAPAPADPTLAVRALRDVALRHHYDTIHRVHCWEVAPRWLDGSLRRTVDRAPADTQALFRLFCFGETVGAAAVERALGSECAARLHAAGLLVAGATGLAARYRLDVVSDQMLLVEWPDARTAGVYYGEDSQFLRAVLAPRPGDVCLDLCTGSGVQALRCATAAAHVDAVDLNPAAVTLARLNAVLNGLEDRVAVYEGDLWDALPADGGWDHVVSNPPLVPVPEAVPYPLCGHGGADGLDVVRRILDGLPTRLSPRGRCTLIGACTGSAEAPAVLAELERTAGAAGMEFSLFLFLRASLRDWVRMLADTVGAIHQAGGVQTGARSGGPAGTQGNTVLRCRARYGSAFDHTWVYTFLVSGERGTGTEDCRVFDYSAFGQRSYWFVNRGRVAP